MLKNTTTTDAYTGRISLKEKIGYGLGDTGFNLFWKFFEFYLLAFYTEVFGISILAAGTMFLYTRIIDAISDPVMGALADRTNTRWGKFRPYLIWGALPMAGAAVLTFTTPDLDDTGKLFWAYGTYTLMMLVYTFVSMPYSALIGVISGKSQERCDLVSIRFVCAFSGGILVSYFTLPLVELLGQGNVQLGWQLTMGLYGVIAGLLFLVTFASTKERIAPPINQKTDVMQDLKDLANNGPWRALFALALTIMLTISLRGAIIYYYLKYYVGNEDLIPNFLLTYSIALLVGAASMAVLTRFFDKKKLIIGLMIIVGLLSVAFFFVPKDQIWLMYLLNIAIGLALGPKSPLVFAMYADAADYNEWKTGRRATAMTYAAATFSQKMGSALAGFLIGAVMAYLGYSANEVQSGSSELGILLLMTLIPGMFAFISAFIMLFYQLDNKQLNDIQSDLQARKNTEQAANAEPLEAH